MTIRETSVYCGARKVWRVLNLSTGTVYSMEHGTKEEADASINVGEVRSGKTVERVDDVRSLIVLREVSLNSPKNPLI